MTYKLDFVVGTSWKVATWKFKEKAGGGMILKWKEKLIVRMCKGLNWFRIVTVVSYWW